VYVNPHVIHILSKDFQGAICAIYPNSPYFIAIIVLNIVLLLTLIVLAVLNRRITIDYRNTSNILFLVLTEICLLGIFINKFTTISFSSNTLLEESILIALYATFVATWITSPAILPLVFDWKVKRKKKAIGLLTGNTTADVPLTSKTLMWVQKWLHDVIEIILIREGTPIHMLAEDLNSNTAKTVLISKNLVSIYFFIHLR
jgi:hypothetical protein